MNRPAIRIGNQTCRFVPARVPYEFTLRHGFQSFEWFSDKHPLGWHEDDDTSEDRAILRRASSESGMTFSVHAPHAADPTTKAGAKAILKSIRFGGDVGADLVNFHLFAEHSARTFAESLGPLLEAARLAGTRISLENTPHTSPDDFNSVFEILNTMPDATGRVGMCLDSGHANLFAGTRNDFLRFVDLLDNHIPIIHWHAHENWGDRDSHLPLFTGPSANDDQGIYGLTTRLKSRGFGGAVVLECWPNPPEILLEARRRLELLFAKQ